MALDGRTGVTAHRPEGRGTCRQTFALRRLELAERNWCRRPHLRCLQSRSFKSLRFESLRLEDQSAGSIHHMLWSFPSKIWPKMPRIITSHDVLELQFRRAGTVHRNPPRPEMQKKNAKKNYKIPRAGLGPEIRKNYPKLQKRALSGHCVFGNFSYFRGPTQDRDFLCVFRVFFCISGLGGFLCPVRARRNRNPWAFKTSTFGITWCDNLWPNLPLEVAERFHIRWRMRAAQIRARQRSGEGVVRRNGCPKGVFLESPFLLCPLEVCSENTWKVLKTLRGQRRNRTLQKHPFGQPFLRTTPSPLLWHTPKRALFTALFVVSKRPETPHQIGTRKTAQRSWDLVGLSWDIGT